jgi:hypothetical protein
VSLVFRSRGPPILAMSATFAEGRRVPLDQPAQHPPIESTSATVRFCSELT